MADVVGVVFRGGVKVYHFDPAGLELSRGDSVVVQTSSGPEIGQVVEPPHIVEDAELPAPLKKVVRAATDVDLENVEAAVELRREAMIACRELISRHGLDMKLVDADVCFGGEKITFSFFAEERVDFRGLVADLAKALKRRIELRQVGAREEARMVGGLGPCGRALCCSCFPGDDTPVSIRMAKEQNLPLNPMKISGLCGRLMCCLKYEQEQYVSFRKEAPAKGTKVITPTGEGVVAGYNFTKQAVAVRMDDGTTTEIRLASCEYQEGGELLVMPEAPEEEPAHVSWLDSHIGLNRLAIADETVGALPVVEAEVILNENGEPVDVVVAESTRKRGRRGRGRRRGGGGEAAREGATSEGAAGAGREPRAGAGAREGGRGGGAGRGTGGQKPGGQGRGGGGENTGEGGGTGESGGSGGRSRRRPAQSGEQQRQGQGRGAEGGRDSASQPAGSAGDGQQGGAANGSRRRRRRPRRPGGGGQGGEGSPGGGAPGGGSGSGE